MLRYLVRKLIVQKLLAEVEFIGAGQESTVLPRNVVKPGP
jgi:hypothetical protein